MAGGHLAGHKSAAADLGAWLCWEDESGQGLRPPKGRTWGRRGRTPVVTVTGGHDTRVSLAALIAVQPGQRPRLIYRTHRARRGDKRKGFTETDYARLLDAAHQQLGGPVVLVWDNLNTHTSRAMRELIAARDWPHGHECHAQADGCPCALGNRAHCRGMMRYNEPLHLSSPAADALPADHVRLAASAYLAGSRAPPASTPNPTCAVTCDGALTAAWTRWPPAAWTWSRYIRWMQEACRLKPSTISRRFSVTAGFYRTCVIDAVLEHSPAGHVRRPNVPAESPTLGFTHLQFEALLTAARESANRYDFALVAMLGLLGPRIFEATGADIADLGEEHGHRVLRVCGKGTKVVLVPLPPAVGRAIDRATADRASGPILLNRRGARMDRHAATRRLRYLAQHAGVRITRPHPTCSGTRHDHARCRG